MSSIAHKSASGVRWSAISQFSQQIIGFIVTAVLARLLSPTDYGLMGLTGVFIGFLMIFSDLGTSAAVVQRKEITQRFLSSIFWANVGIGTVVALSLFFLAELAAASVRDSRVGDLLRVLAWTFMFTSVANVPRALMHRDLRLNRLAIVEIATFVIAGISALIAAFMNLGVWSLVIQSLIATVFGTLLVYFACGWSPNLSFSLSDLRSVARYSLNLSGFVTINYFARNADNFIVGRYLGAQALGYYGLAYRIMFYPLQSVSGVIGRVLFPLFSMIQDDHVKFRRVYLRVAGFIAIITFPMMVGLFILASPAVYVLLGPKWLPIVPVVMVLSFTGMHQSITTNVGHIYTVTGRTDVMLRSGFVFSAMTVLSFIVGLPWGFFGVAVAYSIVSLLIIFPVHYFAFRLIKLPVSHIVLPTWRPLLCSTLMAVPLFGAAYLLGPFKQTILGLGGLVLFGFSCYLLATWFLNRDQLIDFFQTITLRGNS